MRAVAVYPGKPNSVHLAEMAKPSVADVPDGRGVLVRFCVSASMGRTKRSTQRNTAPRRTGSTSWWSATRVSAKWRKSART